jgi:hypothetical protein
VAVGLKGWAGGEGSTVLVERKEMEWSIGEGSRQKRSGVAVATRELARE